MARTTSDSVYAVTIQNLGLYRIRAFAAYPRLTHAIFSRRGGVSQEPYHWLNLGSAVGDDPNAVEKNFQQACAALEVLPEQAVSCHLVHGVDILTATQSRRQQFMGKADGLITNEPDVYLFMRFADCTPLIFFDPLGGAVGLTHAGWRGTMQNAAGATVSAMVGRLGCQPENIMAVIGPAIGPCCYEVGPDVIAAAEKSFSNSAGLFIGGNGNVKFDMWEANRRQLAASGVKQIIQSEICTACHTAEFFSHRAEQGRTGRFGVVIGLRGAAGA
ncbi:MAG: peptidoglycan editing factor PgeF [Anaerolineae bacterium]|nr:peptidoglycan editing factor PgeF [Anaerolineae bacterium]